MNSRFFLYSMSDGKMDKHEKNLLFLKAVAGRPESECESVFLRNKRDLRLALFDLLKPQGTDKASLFQQYKEATAEAIRIEMLEQLLLHFCPNPPFLEICSAFKKGKTPKLDFETAEKLLAFRRGPTKEEVNILFDNLQASETRAATRLLQGLNEFGREIAHQLQYIGMMADADDLELAKAALLLIPKIQGGIEKSLMLYWQKVNEPELRFTALNALQSARNLNPDLLFQIFSPIMQEYERLCRSQGEMNDLWPEYNMIRNILSKNGGAGRVWMIGKDTGLKW